MHFPPPFIPSLPGTRGFIQSSTRIIHTNGRIRYDPRCQQYCGLDRGIMEEGRELGAGWKALLSEVTPVSNYHVGSDPTLRSPTWTCSGTESLPIVDSSPKPNIVPIWCLGNNPTLGHFQVVSVISISEPTGVPKWGFVRLSLLSHPVFHKGSFPFIYLIRWNCIHQPKRRAVGALSCLQKMRLRLWESHLNSNFSNSALFHKFP